MKQVRWTDRAAEDHSDNASAGDKAHTPINDHQNSSHEQGLIKSGEMKLKVFIADDSVEVRNRLKEMLKENTTIHLTGEAADASQTISALHRLKPDVVILDLHMPEGGGLRVLREIKTTDPGRVIIVFTAFSFPQYRKSCLAAGADYFFDKTSDVQEMTDVLAELTRKHVANRTGEM